MGWGPSAPDTSGINQAALTNAQIAQEQLSLGREQFADAKQRQARFDPLFEQIINSSLDSQKTQDERSAQQWKQYTDVFMPAETELANRSMNYDTAGRRDEAGASARAAVETEAAGQRQAQARMLGRGGVSLDAGTSLAVDNANRLATTKLSTGADRAARREVEATGLSLLDNTAKLGRGIASTGLQAAQLAQGAGGAAGGELAQQQGVYNSSLTPGMALLSGATNANTAGGNLLASQAQIQANSQGTGLAGLAGLGQAAGVMYGSGMFSSKKLKTPVNGKKNASLLAPRSKLRTGADVEDAKIIRETPTADAVAQAAPKEGWQYKGDVAKMLGGDDDVHFGSYAEDVQGALGDEAAPGGEMIDAKRVAEFNAQAIAELAQRADRLEEALGLDNEHAETEEDAEAVA